MSRLPFELFLGLRYLRPRRTFVSVITVISILGVTLGVAVLVIVIAVMAGFDREWRTRILSFNADLEVTPASGLMRDYALPMRAISSNQHVTGVAPFVLGQVMVETQPGPGRGDPMIRGPLLRGVDPVLEGRVSVLTNSIIRGSYDLSGKSLLVGCELARDVHLHVGDRVGIMSPNSLQRIRATYGKTNAEAPLADDYIVKGIFDVGFNDFNMMMVATSLENAQDLYRLEEGQVHGLYVKVDDALKADEIRPELEKALGAQYQVTTWTEKYAQLFATLMGEKNMMYYILFFITIVAAFGITNSQITFVVHKTREIGLLKGLGASGQQIMLLFLSQSVVVGVVGVSLGLGLGLTALAWRNEFLHFMNLVSGHNLLPAAIYQIGELPSEILPGDLAIICGGSLVICVLAGLLPAWKAGRLNPVEALRHE